MTAVRGCSEVPLSECDAYKACDKTRADHATAFRAVQEMLAVALDALDVYRELKKAGATERQLAGAKAEVQERVARAERQTVSLLRQLDADGLQP
jgi:hypothetical protein